MNSKSSAKSTDLMCFNCGYILNIYRTHFQKQPFHIKDLWCPNCQTDSKFIELKDKDIMYFKLLNKKNRTEIEEYVFNNLESRKDNEKNKQLEIRK